MADALATVDDYSSRHGDVSDLGQLNAFLDSASARVRTVTGRHLSHVADDTVTLDGPGAGSLHLPNFPVTAVTSITVDGDLLAADGYSWRQSGIVQRVGGCWPSDPRSIVVVYSHGLQAIPEDVIDVVCALANVSVVSDGQPAGGSERLGDWARVYPSASTAEDVTRALLARLDRHCSADGFIR